MIDSVQQTAYDTSVKAKELENTAEEKLATAEKIGKNFFKIFFFEIFFDLGEQKFEEIKQSATEKGSEIINETEKVLTAGANKGSELLDAAQHAIVSGAEVVVEKVKQGFEYVSDTASNVATSAEKLLADVETKASDAADAIATTAVQAKDATVAAAKDVASTLQGKEFSLIKILKNAMK